MSSTDLRLLMHAVLDGEATPGQAAELQRRLAADPGARAEFAQLERLFGELAAVPRKHPPEGLVAAVTAALPVRPQEVAGGDQLPAASRVLAAPQGIFVRPDDPVEEQHQPRPPHRRHPMSQPHPPYSAKRKAWIGAGIALVAVAIVVRFGFDSMPDAQDVAGTVVPAQRYRAPQAAPDIQLGDQSLAQLMQNDAFVRLIRDPEIQALVREPGFAEAARILQDHPEAARLMLVHAESGKQALAAPELARTMEANAEAARVLERTAEAAAALQASPEAQKILASHRELERYVAFFATLERKAGGGQQDYLGKAAAAQADAATLEQRAQHAASLKAQQAANLKAQHVSAERVLALNFEQAQRVAERAMAAEKKVDWRAMERLAADNKALERLMMAHQDMARVAPNYLEAAKQLQASEAAARLAAMDVRATRLMMFNPEVARAIARSPDAMRAVLAHPEAAKLMLASPEAARMLRNPDAARQAMESIAAERAADRAVKMDRAADRAHKADRLYSK